MKCKYFGKTTYAYWLIPNYLKVPGFSLIVCSCIFDFFLPLLSYLRSTHAYVSCSLLMLTAGTVALTVSPWSSVTMILLLGRFVANWRGLRYPLFIMVSLPSTFLWPTSRAGCFHIWSNINHPKERSLFLASGSLWRMGNSSVGVISCKLYRMGTTAAEAYRIYYCGTGKASEKGRG